MTDTERHSRGLCQTCTASDCKGIKVQVLTPSDCKDVKAQVFLCLESILRGIQIKLFVFPEP